MLMCNGGGWNLRLRFGAPIRHRAGGHAHRQAVLARLECVVRDLSAPHA
jgi:hypothetical protein